MCALSDEQPTGLFDFNSNPREAEKDRPHKAVCLFLVLQRGFEPRTPCLKGRIKTACYAVVFNIDNKVDNRRLLW